MVERKGRLGGSPKDDPDVMVLNRAVSWDRQGITYEADQRHVEILLRDLGLSSWSKSAPSPLSREEFKEGDEKELVG